MVNYVNLLIMFRNMHTGQSMQLYLNKENKSVYEIRSPLTKHIGLDFVKLLEK